MVAIGGHFFCFNCWLWNDKGSAIKAKSQPMKKEKVMVDVDPCGWLLMNILCFGGSRQSLFSPWPTLKSTWLISIRPSRKRKLKSPSRPPKNKKQLSIKSWLVCSKLKRWLKRVTGYHQWWWYLQWPDSNHHVISAAQSTRACHVAGPRDDVWVL